MRNLKAENQKLKVKCRNQRLNLRALHQNLAFTSKSDKKKSQEVSALKKEIANLKKGTKKLRKKHD